MKRRIPIHVFGETVGIIAQVEGEYAVAGARHGMLLNGSMGYAVFRCEPRAWLPDGQRIGLHPGIDCHTHTQMVRGTGRRPRIARRRRPWLRARRQAMRKTGQPPKDESTTYVRCRGYGETEEQLEGAF